VFLHPVGIVGSFPVVHDRCTAVHSRRSMSFDRAYHYLKLTAKQLWVPFFNTVQFMLGVSSHWLTQSFNVG